MRIVANFGYKLLSVAIAFCIWLAVQDNTEIQKAYTIRVVLEGVPENLIVTHVNTDTVNVRVKGNRALLRQVQEDTLEYPVDLEEARPGVADFDVNLRDIGFPNNVQVVSRSPARIQASLDLRISRQIGVKADVTGEPAAGYRVTDILVEPPVVTIEGARSEILGTPEITTEAVDLNGAKASFVRDVRISTDAEHVRVKDPQQVRVAVSLQAEDEEENGDDDAQATP